MSSKFRDGQPWWFLPAIALFLGILIGWLVIGWGVWPVTYKNALPQDLRAAEQQEYLLMTAESFANSGDLETARQRVSMWPREELEPALANLIQRVEEANPLQASQVMLLEGALYPGAVTAVEGGDTTPAIIPESSTGATNLLQTACITALWVLLALGGILGILYLWRRWRMASQAEPPDIEAYSPPPAVQDTGGQSSFSEVGMYDDDLPQPLISPSAREVAPVIVQGEVNYDEDEFEEDIIDEELEPAEPLSEDNEAEIEVVGSGASRRYSRPGVEPEQVEKAALAAAAVTSTGGMTRVGEYKAQYDMGAADYDEAFDIHDTNDAYVGQCGLELVDPVGKLHDQAAALQVWLWDTNDPDTKVKVLMSEGAYRDTAMRDQLAGDHEVLLVRAGTEFELRSYNLLLKGVVDKVEYAEQEPVGGIFSELRARMAVYVK